MQPAWGVVLYSGWLLANNPFQVVVEVLMLQLPVMLALTASVVP
jgi:hypothetical protein